MVLRAVPSAWGRRAASGCRGAPGSPTSPPPAVSQALRAPFKSSRPSGGPGGIIPACPGWTQVEQARTSGTRPRRRPGLPAFVHCPERPPPPARCFVRPSWVARPRARSARSAPRHPGLGFPACAVGASRGCPLGPSPRAGAWARVTWAEGTVGMSPSAPASPGRSDRPPPGLCSGNSWWQGEPIPSPPECSRGKCC